MWLSIAATWWAAAQAQVPDASGNVQLLHSSIDAQNTLWTDDASRRGRFGAGARAQLSWTYRPLVWEVDEDEVEAVVGSVWQLDVLGAGSLGPVRLGLDLPVLLGAGSGVLSGGGAALGDIALDGKLVLLDPDVRVLGLAVAGRLSLPTGTSALPLAREGLETEVTAIVDYEVGAVLRLLGNVGARFGAPITLGSDEIGDQLLLRVGAAVPVTDRAGVSAEFAGRLPLSAPLELGAPAEVLLGGWIGLDDALTVRAGLGRGFSSAVGAPAARVLLSVAYEPELERRRRPRTVRSKVPIDTDRDGIDDALDDCPEGPEDIDGYLDSDGCPDDIALVVRVQDARGAIVHGAFAWVECDTGEARLTADAAVQLTAGTCTLLVGAPGWSEVTDTLVLEQGPPIERTLQLLPLGPVGHVTVRVTDDAGGPLHASWTVGDEPSSLPLRQGRGIMAVRPGSYRVEIRRPGFVTEATTVTVEAGAEVALDVVLSPE